jgi:hypothetical protein
MTHKIASGKHLGRSLTTMTAALLIASISVVTIPTKASAFDIGGMIGTAMAIQMNGHHGGYAGGGYHAHSRVSSRQDSDSNDHGSSSRSTGERDALEPNATDQSKSGNKLAMQSPAAPDGLTQASERDAAAGQASGSSRSFNDAPAFTPSR